MEPKTIEQILDYLDSNEIDYRIESNFCCGYIFYFLDGSVYPRRYYDHALEGNEEKYIVESVEHIIEKAVSFELKKDWKHRIEADTIQNLFKEVWNYITSKTPNP